MTQEYIIISKTTIQKRIEELEKTQNIYAPSGHFPNLVMYERTLAEKHTLQYLLSQSTPLIPEIEKAFDEANDPKATHITRLNYINNLKLDI